MDQRRTNLIARVPGFAAEVETRLHRLDGCAVVVVTGQGSRALVVSVNRRALALGIHPGMRTDSIGILDCRVLPLSKKRCAYATRELLEALRLPLPDPRELRLGVFASCWTGGTRMLEGAREEADRALRTLGFSASWGIGPETAVAEIAARVAGIGRVRRVETEQVRSFLTPLPVAALPDLKQQQCDALREIGVHTLGQLAVLPDVVLREMFGPEGVPLKLLALQGRRPDVEREWRGFRRLEEDSDDPGLIRDTLAALVSEGLDALTRAEKAPRGLYLMIVYSDHRRRGMRKALKPEWHEGRIQRVAGEMLEQIWMRRVRLSEIRLTLYYGHLHPQQYSLFVPAGRVGRDDALRQALLGIRRRWGGNVVSFASAHTPIAAS